MSVKRLQTIPSNNIEALAAATQREFDNVYRNLTAAEYSVDTSVGLTLSGRQIGAQLANSGQTGMLTASDWVRFNDAALRSISSGNVSATDRLNWDAAYNHSLITDSNPHTTRLDQVYDPTADKLFLMGTKHLAFRFVNPSAGGGYDGALEIDGTGNFTGDLVHIHQSAGNSSSSQDILHVEVNAVASSANPLRVSTSAGDALLIPIDRSIALYGPVKIGTNYAAAGAIRLANSASIYWRNAANGADAAYFVADNNDNMVLSLTDTTKQLYLYGQGIWMSRAGQVKITMVDTGSRTYEINNSGGILYFKNATDGSAYYQFGKSDSVYNIRFDATTSPYIAIGQTVSTDGNAYIRIPNAKQIGWRNAADNGNVGLLVNNSNQLYTNAPILHELNAGGTNWIQVLYSGTKASQNTAYLMLNLSANTAGAFKLVHVQNTSSDNDTQLLVQVPDGTNAMSFQRNKDVYSYGSLYVTTQVRAGNSVYLYVDASNYISWTYDANNFYNYSTGRPLYLGTGTTGKALVFVAEGVGVASFTGTAFSITPSTTIANTSNLGSYTYASGYFGGGWRMGYDASQGHTLELDNLIVRNTLRAFIFQKDIVRASNGYLLISDCSEIVYATATTDNPLYIYTKEDVFQAGDLLWYKDIDEATGLVVTGIKITVSAVGGSVTLPNGGKSGYRYTYTVSSGSGTFKVGGVIVRVGSSVAGRQGSIYFDASTASTSPFMDIYDGVTTWTDFQSTAKTKARVGKLSGITSFHFGALSGYGVWSQNMYLEGDAHIAGTITAGWLNNVGNSFYAGKIVVNLVAESENLSTTPWTVSLGSATRTANDAVAPDGTTTGTKLVINATPTFMQGTTATLTSSTTYLVSMWLKSTYSSGSVYIKLNQGNSATLIGSTPNDNTWRRYYVLCTAGSGTAGIELQLFPSGATYWIWGVTVEAVTANGMPTPYQRTTGTLSDYTLGGMWARRGGFGGSIQNPYVWLTDRGLELRAGATSASQTKLLIGRGLSAYYTETGLQSLIGLYNANDYPIIRMRSTADNTGEWVAGVSNNNHAYMGLSDGTRWTMQFGTLREFDGTTAASVVGMRLLDTSGNTIFQSDSSGVSQIAAWKFSTTSLMSWRGTTPDKGIQFDGGDVTYMPRIVVAGNANGPTYITMGGYIYDGTWRNDYWGLVIRANSNNLFRCYYGPIAGSPALTADIAGWSFDYQKFYKGSVAIDSSVEKFIAGNSGGDASGTGIRAVFGKFNGTDYGIRCWDGTTTYFQLSSSTSAKQNLIANFFFDSTRIWSGSAVVGSYYRHISMNSSNARLEWGYSLTQNDSAFTMSSWIGWNGSLTGVQIDSQYITFQQGSSQTAVEFSTYGLIKTQALMGLSGTPTASWSVGAGTTGATSVTINGTNLAGRIRFTTTSGPTTGLLVTMTFQNSGYLGNLNPYVLLTAGNTATAAKIGSFYVSTNSGVFYIYIGTSALVATTAYDLYYAVIG